MALIEWNDSLSVGVPSIDAQHAVLVETLNDLHDAMMSGQGHARTGALLSTLISYAHDHFAAEEAMLEAAGYAQLDAHRAHHRGLTRQVQNYVARYERGEATVNMHLLNFLRDWLTNHIMKEDKAYSSTMVAHGIK